MDPRLDALTSSVEVAIAPCCNLPNQGLQVILGFLGMQGSKASVFNQSHSANSPQTKVSTPAKEQEETSPAKLDSSRHDNDRSRLWLYGNLSSSPGLPGMLHTLRLEPGGAHVR